MSRIEELVLGLGLLALIVAWLFGWGRTDKDSWDAPEVDGRWNV